MPLPTQSVMPAATYSDPWAGLKIASTRGMVPQTSATLTSISAAATEISFGVDVYVNQTVDNPRILVPSWYIPSSGTYDETTMGNNLNYRFALEDKATGKVWGFTFGGQETVYVNGLANILSDANQIRLASGSYRIRPWVQGDVTGDSIPVSQIRYSRTTTGQFAVETVDGILAGSDGRYSAIGSFTTGLNGTLTYPGGFGLVGHIVDQTEPTLVVIGDSISVAGGTGGAVAINSGAWTMFQESWINIGLRRTGFYGLKNTKYNVLWCSRGGVWAKDVASNQGAAYRRQLFGLADIAVIALGINDANNSRTSAQIIADLTTIIQHCASMGVAIIGCTLTPLTTSSDSYVTASNQAATAASPVIQAVNLWWRDGTAAAVTRAAGGTFLGIWDGASKVTVNSSNVLDPTADRWYAPSGNAIVEVSTGVHPMGGSDATSYVSSGHTYMSAGVDTSMLTYIRK